MRWLKRKLADIRERPDDNVFLYDLYPFGTPTYIFWMRRGFWGVGLDVGPEVVTLTAAKFTVTINRDGGGDF